MNSRWINQFICTWFVTILIISSVHAGEIVAELQWSKRLILSTTETGVVGEVVASPGQKVKKGEVLLSLDQREFVIANNKAVAKRLAAKTTHEEAKREQYRAQDLYDRTMLSEHDLQVTKNNKAHARAAYLEAEAMVKKTELALERSRISAPYDAIVLDVYAQVGQTVISHQTMTPLALIAEDKRMQVRAWLSNTDFEKYSNQKATSVRLGNKQYKVVSQYIVAEANDKGMYALTVDIDISDANLRAGQAATIIFP